MPHPPNGSSSQERPPKSADAATRMRKAQDELVDLASELSFPASDPPPFWAGTDAEETGDETEDA